MSYKNLSVQNVEIIDDQAVKKNTEWRCEKAPGIVVYMQNVSNAYMPAYVALSDKEEGIKYGVYVQKPTPIGKDKRWVNKGYAGVMANIDMRMRREHDYVVEFLNDKLSAADMDDDDLFSFCDNNITRIWTRNRSQYEKLISVIFSAISETAAAIYKERDDGVPDLNEITSVKLKKSEAFIYNGKSYYDLEEMYFAVANDILPSQLCEGIIGAMANYQPNNGHELTCCIDPKKSALVFYENEKKPFYRYECDLIKQCDKWCTSLELSHRQEGTHWLSDAMSEANNKGAFKDISSVSIIGEYDYGCGDMDVVFEK